jgi:oligosaccharide repeat unit polymerase
VINLVDTVVCGSANASPDTLPSLPFSGVAPLWYLLLVAVGFAFQLQTRWFTKFNIFTVFLVGMFVRYGIAVPISDNINPASTFIPISRAQLVEYYVALTITYFGVFVGAYLVYRWERWPAVLRRWPTHVDPRALIVIGAAVFALVVLVWVVLPWSDFKAGLLSAGHIQQLVARAQRVTYGNATLYSNSALNYLGSFARFAIMPAVVWVLYFHRGRSRIVHALFWIGLATLGVIGFSSGQKTPELLLVIGFVIARVLIAGAPSIFNWKIVTGGIAFVFGLVPLLYHFQVSNWTYPQLVYGTLFRFTIEYSRVAQLRFIFYPDMHPFLNGTSSFVVRGIARLGGVHLSGESPETYIPTHSPCVGANYGGTWNAGFFADAWADFGWAGVIVAAIVAGVILALIARWYESSPKGPLQMGTYTAACVSALYLSEVALPTASWTFGLVSSFLVYWILGLFPDRKSNAIDRPEKSRLVPTPPASP